MKNYLLTDPNRGSKIAEYLYHTFRNEGIHGRNDMPEDIILKTVKRGSLEHLLFITQTVSIDYQRDANKLWKYSRITFEDPDTRYLFNPADLQNTPIDKIISDMQKYRLSKKPIKDANIWRTVGISFFQKWGGDPRKFLENCNWDAPTIISRLKTDKHDSNSTKEFDFPYLKGNKIGPLWLRMLRDNVGINNLRNLDKIPIPVDIHIARASLTTGIVRGKGSWSLNGLFEKIREAWSEGVKGIRINSRPMIALDVDEPLWHLSKYGCTKRDKETGNCPVFNTCEAKDYCIKGNINIEANIVTLDT